MIVAHLGVGIGSWLSRRHFTIDFHTLSLAPAPTFVSLLCRTSAMIALISFYSGIV